MARRPVAGHEPPPSAGVDGPFTRHDPLAGREVRHTTSLEQIRSDLSTLFYPARIEPVSRGNLARASHLSAGRTDNITVGFLRFGSDVVVDPGPLGAYHINVPISGTVRSECGHRQVLATTRRGAVFTPHEPTVLPRWSEDAAQLCIKIRRAAVEAELQALLGRPVTGVVDFGLGFDLGAAGAQSWLDTLRMLVRELDRPGGLLETSPPLRRHLEKLLIGGLLWVQAHRWSDELRKPEPPARPRTLKRVLDLIDTDPTVNHTVSDLARHAGVSARRLQSTFQETLGVSPSAYQRRAKLDGARGDLTAGAESVMAIAHHWGFSNPGRFARYYHDVYGETPSQTVRRYGR